MNDENTLQSVLKSNSIGRFFIPAYQRDYAWERKNFEELWADLEENIELEKENAESSQDKGHFLGTIVVAPHNGNKNEADVIDGQQRLTTTFMMLIVLWEKIGKDEQENIGKNLLYCKGEYKLQVSEVNRDFFKHILESAGKDNLPSKNDIKISTQGQQNLYDVFNAILGAVKNFSEEKAQKYFDKLLSMRFICFKEENTGAAIRTFQSVNDRGVPLRLMDKLKSLLIYYSNRYCEGENGLDDEINQYFGEIFRISSEIFKHDYRSSFFATQSNDVDDIERNIFRYHIGSKIFANVEFLIDSQYDTSSEMRYTELKNKLKALKSDRERLKSFLREYSEDLKAFFAAVLDILKDIDKNQAMFMAIMIENLNPVFYNTFVRLKIDDNLDETMIRLFTKSDCILNKFNGKRADPYYFIKAYCETRDAKSLEAEIYKKCKACRVENNINDFVDNTFINQANHKVFHYLFIEQHSKDMSVGHLNELLTNNKGESGKRVTQEMEHIISQSVLGDDSNPPNSITIKDKGFDSVDDLKKYINTYGNFLSLEKRLNSGASNKSDIEKRKEYAKSALPFVKSFEPKNVNKHFIMNENEEMKQWLKEEFFKDFL